MIVKKENPEKNSLEEELKFLDHPIHKLDDLSNRAFNILKEFDIYYSGEVVSLTYKLLVSIKRCGKKTAGEIEHFVNNMGKGYKLGEDIGYVKPGDRK